MEIFWDQGSSGAGGTTGEGSLWEELAAVAYSSGTAGALAHSAGDCGLPEGGATLRESMGSKRAFCSTHLAAKPLSGLLMLNS